MTDPRQSLAMARIGMVIIPCLLVITALITPAQAEPQKVQSRVEYADLDLSSAAGRAALDKRLDVAIRTVCRTRFSRSVRVVVEARACMAEVYEDVRPQRDAILAKAEASGGAKGAIARKPS